MGWDAWARRPDGQPLTEQDRDAFIHAATRDGPAPRVHDRRDVVAQLHQDISGCVYQHDPDRYPSRCSGLITHSVMVQ